MKPPTLLLLGAGELGKEFVISAKRLGCTVYAAESYPGAPAMQLADAAEVVNMLDGDALESVVRKFNPDFIVPEIEAIRTERLLRLEEEGFTVIPSARAAHLTMNRDAIRDVAANTLGIPTARFAYAESEDELRERVLGPGSTNGAKNAPASKNPRPIGLPCVVKPVMSSSGKGQSVLRKKSDIAKAWAYAMSNSRGDTRRVIVEEFIDFQDEITLLTIKPRPTHWTGRGGAPARGSKPPRTLFVRPIGHRQERGDFQESWMPCAIKPSLVKEAQKMARRITDEIAGPDGAGIFGVEFFVTRNRVIFSELSPRPHDTGMVTLISQDLSEFDLHLRAILGLPIPDIHYEKAAASAVILADAESTEPPAYEGIDRALALKNVDVRIFGKPSTRKYRRMGVALATAKTPKKARQLAAKAASLVKVVSSPQSTTAQKAIAHRTTPRKPDLLQLNV